jgi:hypothetical protein
MVTLTTGTESFTLTRSEANDLELKLNVSNVGKAWRLIGDVLFDVSSGNKDAVTTYTVTQEQFSFLQLLRTKKGWESCVGLSPA